MELPIVVSVDEFNVGSFVNQIDLSVDVGPEGRRGSITFAGSGTPPETPTAAVTDIYGMVSIFEPGDLYIRTGTGTPYYAYLYIYQQNPGGNEWVPICPLQPDLYNNEVTLAFTAGVSAEIEIPFTDIFGTDTTSLAAADFIIQATCVDSGTDVHVAGIKTVTVDNGNGVLKLVFNGRTLGATTVANASGSIVTKLSIGVKSSG